MFWFNSLLLLTATLAANGVVCSPAQVPFQLQSLKSKQLRGRFLHITDIHPDPYYAPGTSQSTACHRKKPRKKKSESKYYGTPYSKCDSPLRLANHTLNFLKENWADEIDFVIWTGDNARHDDDRKLPRTPSEIFELNRAVASKMQQVFSNRGIPVVPSLGNNDVWPHNILSPGMLYETCPNSITNEFSSIWSPFIPFPYLQVFQRGAYYTVEVIPDEVAVVSLNTMYFYDSNKVVSGCAFKEPNDPGNLQFDWLEVQLEEYRNRGMQVWISGHVPPSPGNYFPECYVRYVELALRFQDTILGHLYGHMNVDHFFFLESGDLGIYPEAYSRGRKGEAPTPANEGGLYKTLIEEFSALPKSPEMTDYAVVNVAPSVVPNPYVPAFRIFSYNITDTRGDYRTTNSKRKHGHPRGDKGNKTVHCDSEEYQDTWRCHLDRPWFSDPDSPSRKNQQWSPLGYAQYYIPDLGEANKTHPPNFELEYLTYQVESLHPHGTEQGFVYPVPVRHLPEGLREPGLEKSRYCPYRMEDLTIPSWIRLARQLSREKRQKLRKRFRRYMFVGGKHE